MIWGEIHYFRKHPYILFLLFFILKVRVCAVESNEAGWVSSGFRFPHFCRCLFSCNEHVVSKVWRLFGRFQSVKLRKTAIRFFGEQEILKVSLVAAFQNDPMVFSTLFFFVMFWGGGTYSKPWNFYTRPPPPPENSPMSSPRKLFLLGCYPCLGDG